MPKLIVLVGPPGSGKSTLAKQMVTDSPESLVYINQDSQGKEYENIFKQSLIKNENILITGSTGIGKSYIGSAFGHQACCLGYRRKSSRRKFSYEAGARYKRKT